MSNQRKPKGNNPYLANQTSRAQNGRDRVTNHGAPNVKSEITEPRTPSGKRKSRRRRNGNTRFVVMSLLFVLLVGAILTFTVFFNVDTVIIKGETRYTDLQISSAGDIKIGDNLFFAADGKSCKNIMTNLPYIYDITVDRQFPSTLVLTVHETPAFFTIVSGREYILLDGNMKVLEKTSSMPSGDVVLIEGATPVEANIGYEIVFSQTEAASLEDLEEGEVETPRELIDRIIAAMISEEFSGLTKIDISDRLNIQLVYQDRLTLIMGTPTELEYKLRFAAKSIEKLEEGAKGYLNLSVPKNAFYSPNNSKVGEVLSDE